MVDGTHVATVEGDDFGDYVQNVFANSKLDIVVVPFESHTAVDYFHQEAEKFYGYDWIEDCPVIFDSTAEYDVFCPGCRMFVDWSENKTVGDYYKAVETYV